MKILFWLYKSRINKAGQAPIMMRITINGQRESFSTNIFLEIHCWDSTKQRVKGNSDLSNAHNNILNTLKSKAWHEFNEHLRKGTELNPKNIRDILTGQSKPTVTLLEAVKYHLNYLEGRVEIDIAHNTVKKYKTLLKKLIAYLAHIGLTDIALASLNKIFITDFWRLLAKYTSISLQSIPLKRERKSDDKINCFFCCATMLL